MTASASAAPIVCIGLRLEYGSWKTICTVPRSRRRSLPDSVLQSAAGMPSRAVTVLVPCLKTIRGSLTWISGAAERPAGGAAASCPARSRSDAISSLSCGSRTQADSRPRDTSASVESLIVRS